MRVTLQRLLTVPVRACASHRSVVAPTDALSIFVAVVDCARAHADNNWVTTGQSVPLLQSTLVAHSSLKCNVHTKFVEAPAAMQSK